MRYDNDHDTGDSGDYDDNDFQYNNLTIYIQVISMQQQRSNEHKQQLKLQEIDSKLIENKRQIENNKIIDQKRYERQQEIIKYDNMKLEKQRLADQYCIIKK